MKRPLSECSDPVKDDPVLKRVHALARVARDNSPDPHYISRLPTSWGITHRLREQVVKIINQLAEDFRLQPGTAGLACNYFDRCVVKLFAAPTCGSSMDDALLSIKTIASACLLIASKFADRCMPPLSELEKVHDNRINSAYLAKLELDILALLKWNLYMPMPHAIVDDLLELCNTPTPSRPRLEIRILFFIDLSVYGMEFLGYGPVVIAAVAILIAWKSFGEEQNLSSSEVIDKLCQAAEVKPERLYLCANSLVRYYFRCFPDSAYSPTELVITPADLARHDAPVAIQERASVSSPVKEMMDLPAATQPEDMGPPLARVGSKSGSSTPDSVITSTFIEDTDEDECASVCRFR